MRPFTPRLMFLALATAALLSACDESPDPDAGSTVDTDAAGTDAGDTPPNRDAGDGVTDGGPGMDAGRLPPGVDGGPGEDSGLAPTDAGPGAADAGPTDPDAGPGFGTAMSFFVSSAPVFDRVGAAATGDVPGDGDLVFTVPGSSPPMVLRGVEAADAFCLDLARAAGSPRPTWRAYLSTHGLPEAANPAVRGPQINAADRVGAGPWYNANRDVLADTSGRALTRATLHVEIGVVLGEGRDANAPANAPAVATYLAARPNEALVLNENGVAVALRSHDIFTGSGGDGRVYDGGMAERWFASQRGPAPGPRTAFGTCNDWNYQRFGAPPGVEFAQTGHTDVPSGGFSPSWNSAHDSQNCTVSGVASRGGAGHVYCFSPD